MSLLNHVRRKMPEGAAPPLGTRVLTGSLPLAGTLSKTWAALTVSPTISAPNVARG
jgi:hypothetical protein